MLMQHYALKTPSDMVAARMEMQTTWNVQKHVNISESPDLRTIQNLWQDFEFKFHR